MIKVQFFTLLRLLVKIPDIEMDCGDMSVLQLLLKTEMRMRDRFIHKLLNEDRSLRTGTIILVNGKNILHLDGLPTIVHDGDTVALFPPGGGG